MSLLCSSPSSLIIKNLGPCPPFASASSNNKIWGNSRISRTHVRTRACFNPFEDQPILKDALKEPVAFMGGVFAGLLRLDLNEEPLREWITKTVEASGMSPEELANAQELRMGGEDDEAPQQIEIE